MRTLRLAVLALALLFAAPGPGSAAAAPGHDWTRFGWDARRSSSPPFPTGIAAADVSRLRRLQVQLPGTADSSPIYLHDVTIGGATHDAFFLTTTYGITVAVDADSGAILWTWTPPGSDVVGRLVADHDCDARRRPGPAVALRRLAGRPHPEARRRRRPRRLADGDHAAARAREDRRGAQPRPRPCDRDDGRLLRRPAALPGSRRDPRREDRPAPPRLELALLEPPRADRARLVPVERLGDLGPRRRRRRPRQRQPARRDRQRALERPHRLGRLRRSCCGPTRHACSATTRRRTPRS